MKQCIDYSVGVLITQYELGELSDEDRNRFEEHLMDCDFCSAEIAHMEPLIDAIRENKPELMEKLHACNIHYRSIQEEPVSVSQEMRGRVSLVESFIELIRQIWQPKVTVPALVTVAILAVLVILPHSGQQTDNPFLPHLYFAKAPYRHLRSAEEVNGQQFFIDGMTKYMEDDYQAAIANLLKATEQNPTEGRWWMYLGVCYFMDRQPESAIDALTKAEALTEYTLNRRSRWYLAQSYLLAGDASGAKPLLEDLVHQDDDYAVEAATLLDAIEAESPP